jgi:hypothetical protein
MKLELKKTERCLPWPPWAIAVVLLWGALVVAAIIVETKTGQRFVFCPLKRISGIPCPACGSMRSISSLLQGDLLAALSYNPLFLVLAWVGSTLLLTRVVSGWTVRLSGDAATTRRLIWGALLGLVLANWVYLMVAVETI